MTESAAAVLAEMGRLVDGVHQGARADAVGAEEALELTRAAQAARQRVVELEYEAVETARRAGATWPQVAEAMGVRSYQAAEQRHTRNFRELRDVGQDRNVRMARLGRRSERKTTDRLRALRDADAGPQQSVEGG